MNPKPTEKPGASCLLCYPRCWTIEIICCSHHVHSWRRRNTVLSHITPTSTHTKQVTIITLIEPVLRTLRVIVVCEIIGNTSAIVGRNNTSATVTEGDSASYLATGRSSRVSRFHCPHSVTASVNIRRAARRLCQMVSEVRLNWTHLYTLGKVISISFEFWIWIWILNNWFHWQIYFFNG